MAAAAPKRSLGVRHGRARLLSGQERGRLYLMAEAYQADHIRERLSDELARFTCVAGYGRA